MDNESSVLEKQLPRQAEEREVRDDSQCAPRMTNAMRRADIDRFLALVWQEILRVEHVESHHNFFELGGHSIAVVNMLSRVREKFDVDVLVSDVFLSGTLAEVADLIYNKQNTTNEGGEFEEGII